MYANFLLGRLKVTTAAKVKLKRTPLDLVARHAIGDHGEVSTRQLKQNQAAFHTASQIVSRYRVVSSSTEYVRVVTDDGWENTTVELENETCSPLS